MRLVCDENIRHSHVTVLQQEHHEVSRLQDELGVGTPDAAILEYCREVDAVLLTNDDDFLDLDPSEHAGIIYVTDQSASARTISRAIGWIEDTLDRDAIAVQALFVPDGWV